ncbi:PIN domain-containing protein [Candidatus Micrarchaeota archaeon]|nr:PIN domain-containing protein [Candidatus Micrarchaeota archaeon]
MPKRIYLDSNVFISLIREEIDSSLNLLYIDSQNFFSLCSEENHVLILSGWFFEEISRKISFSREEVLQEFKKIGIAFFIVDKKPSKDLISMISKECEIHFGDAIHMAIAYENKADFIATWNKKDFEKGNKFVKCFSPKEISYIL